MKANVKRYIQLDNQIFENRKKVEKFESGYFYNSTKSIIWKEKEKTAIIKKQELEFMLTLEEKKEIENYYQINQMFDY